MTDRRRNKKSKEEIAKEFDLPERKSKIATIMKQDGQAYCICRSSDCSRFMIGCDGCEEWYHGDCINISKKEAKHIRQYYCNRCKEENPELQTIFRLEKVSSHINKESGGSQSNSDQDRRKKHGEREQRNDTSNLLQSTNDIASGTVASEITPAIFTQPMEQPPIRTYNRERTHKRNREKVTRERMRKRKRSPTPEVFINPELEGLRQCLGPTCTNNARPQSKYCNDTCGVRLATSRIFQVLPQRLQEWSLSGCRAEDENKKQLDQIRSSQSLVRFTLAELDKRHQELDMVVERAKHSTLDPNRAQDNNDIEDEQSMYCLTCGHEIHSRTAIKHMEKCFNKYESQASFGSIFKTRIEGNSMFCDFYNPASKTYCKRLRVLCPEHCKDPKVNDNDVCGCPLVSNVFQLTGDFCRAPKKTCFKHYVWEKIRRAEIDLERVRQWIRMDELLEQERQIRHQMASRAGVLDLMLHSTYNHELMEELCRQQQIQLAAAQKQKELLEKRQHRQQVQQKRLLQSTQTPQLYNLEQQIIIQQQSIPKHLIFIPTTTNTEK